MTTEATKTRTPRTKKSNDNGVLAALDRVQAIIEFELDGTIVTANKNFCDTVGYELSEIEGRHHSVFVAPDYASSSDYKALWQKLGNGEFVAGEFKRFGKGGREIWIQASYNPVFDDDGNPVRVVKFATDITEAKRRNAFAQGQVDAIGRSQAVITFELDGTIVDANDNFCQAVGYSLDEIRGKHHSMFAEGDYAASFEYKQFWEKLRSGEFAAGEYKRIGKGGKVVWINASYNPILDADGKPFRVVKYATDITASKEAVEEISNALSTMATGDFSVQIDRELDGEFETVRQDFNSTLQGLKEKEDADQKVAAENFRLRQALDKCQTNVMVSDEDYQIVYMNETMQEMIQAAESDLRKDIPSLNARELVGANVDVFHKDPSYQRRILDGLTETIETDIEIGGRSFHLVVTPVVNEEGTRLGTVVEWRDETEAKAKAEAEKKVAAENFRLRQALDKCKTNVMVADADYEIVYLNETMTEMMQVAEADLRKDIPSLDSRNLIGANIDVFHKNPAHQRRILDTLATTIETDIAVGGRSFHLVVTPVIDEENVRQGTVVEWRDETAEKAVEAELNSLVGAAVAGDFSRRVELEDKQGFMLRLGESMNALCTQMQGAMEDITMMFGALAEGDLTTQIENDYQGALGELKNNANQTVERLASTVSQILSSASEVASAAAEISAGTSDLSQRTEQQASNLEQTAASMEELATTVKQNAENAQNANELSLQARDMAAEGGDVVAKAVDAMARISESSTKISEITSVIDGIAFQTNLLALNAAVEAARAGDAGRGFAVVASEVRNLAQRSSEAAKDINGLINQSSVQVKDGVDLVNRTGSSLSEIVGSIKRVTDIVAEIAAASNEQATGIDEVNTATSQMDEMTQQNSALVEESAAAAKTLQDQAASMTEQMQFFRLEGATGQPRVTGPKPVKAQRSVPSPAARMQSALAVAVDQDPDWKEF